MELKDLKSFQDGKITIPVGLELVSFQIQPVNIKRSVLIMLECEGIASISLKSDHVLATGDKSKKQVISYVIKEFKDY